jgi:hypothetical protein
MENYMSNYLYFNGRKDKPQIFANLIKNSDPRDLQKMFVDTCRFSVEKKQLPGPEGFFSSQKNRSRKNNSKAPKS